MMARYGQMNWLRQARQSDRAAVAQALAQVGMEAHAKRQIDAFWRQRKRVFLPASPESFVILLDEPWVDVETEDAIIALLKRLRNEGRIILVSTHNLGSFRAFVTAACCLKRRCWTTANRRCLHRQFATRFWRSAALLCSWQRGATRR